MSHPNGPAREPLRLSLSRDPAARSAPAHAAVNGNAPHAPRPEPRAQAPAPPHAESRSEQIAREVADDLTDLFLSDEDASPRRAPAAQPAHPAPGRSIPGPLRAADRPAAARDLLDPDELDELLAPVEFDADDEPDEHPEPRGPRSGPPAEPPPIEALILGHLPVRASIWVRQHARDRSADLGAPVALLTVREGHCTIELIEGHRPTGEAPERPQQLAATEDLDEAIARAASRAARVLVSTDETDEPALLSLRSLAAVTLLTGADEAAVVACYRSLKALAARLDEFPEPRPEIGVAILGAVPERGEHARRKLADTAASFLPIPVDVRVSSQRVTGSPSLALHHARVDADDPAREVLRRLEALAPGGPAPTARDTARSRVAAFADARDEEAAPEIWEPGPADLPPTPEAEVLTPAPTPAAEPQPEIAAAPSAPAVPVAEVEAKPAEQRTPEAGVPAEALFAAARLSALDVACPHAPEVRLAVDADGTLHAVDAAAMTGGRPDLAGLHAAAGWARTNGALLARIEPRLRPTLAPVLHVLLPDAREARPLLDADLRVHVAASTGNGWLVLPLNGAR